MRRRALLDNKRETIKPSKAAPLSVVFAHKNTGNLEIVENDKWSLESHPASIFEPIGIVVIPGEHGVLKDGTGNVNQCGVMSIMSMSYSTPEEGDTTEQGMYWGGYNVDIVNQNDGLLRFDSIINGLINYNKIACDTSGSNKSTQLITGGTHSFIPRQGSVGGTPVWDSRASTDGYSPSPYANSDLKSGPYNNFYGTTEFDTTSDFNVLGDFNGIGNTKIITDMATAQTDWKTAEIITRSYSEGFYPAACCCARYKTVGTLHGP